MVGVLFLVWHNEVNLFNWLVRALGVMLMVPGIYLLRSALKPNKQSDQSGGRRVLSVNNRPASAALTVVSLVTVILGLWMLVAPTFFVGLVAYLFATALLVYGVYQIVTVAYFCRPVIMPWYYYVVPSITVVAGIVIFVTPVRTMNTIVTLLTGLMLIFAAVNWTIQRLAIHSIIRRMPEIYADGSVNNTTDELRRIEGSDV